MKKYIPYNIKWHFVWICAICMHVMLLWNPMVNCVTFMTRIWLLSVHIFANMHSAAIILCQTYSTLSYVANCSSQDLFIPKYRHIRKRVSDSEPFGGGYNIWLFRSVIVVPSMNEWYHIVAKRLYFQFWYNIMCM